MLYYPQLASGALCQFPATARTTIRTVSNELIDGSTIRMSDQSESSIQWQLQYTGLTDGEWASIEQLFEASEGRLNSFTFLDPMGNLLNWTEDWAKPIWSADPLLQVSGGVQDPFGGSNGVQLTNTAQSTQRIMQTIASASWFRYCYSLYLRSDSPSLVELVVSASGQESLASVVVGTSWARTVHSTVLSAGADTVGFGIQLPSGTRIEAFGPQVEAQGGASDYKRTIDRSGVYPKTRFDLDVLRVTTSAPGQHASTVILVSNLV